MPATTATYFLFILLHRVTSKAPVTQFENHQLPSSNNLNSITEPFDFFFFETGSLSIFLELAKETTEMFASASQALVLSVHQHDPAWFPNSYIKCWLRTKLDLTFFFRVSVSMQWLEARDHISAPYTIDFHLLPLSPWQCWWLVHSRQALYHWVTSQPSALLLESGCVTKLRVRLVGQAAPWAACVQTHLTLAYEHEENWEFQHRSSHLLARTSPTEPLPQYTTPTPKFLTKFYW